MSTPAADQTPEARALLAAEQIEAGGEKVTGEAIRRRAGVGMATATAVAKRWNQVSDQRREQAQAGPVPAEMQARFAAMNESIWEEAMRASRGVLESDRRVLEGERIGLETTISDQATTIEQLEEDKRRIDQDRRFAAEEHEILLRQSEKETEEASQRASEAQEQLRTAQAELVAASSRADRAEAALEISQKAYGDLQAVVATLTTQLEHLRGPQQLSA